MKVQVRFQGFPSSTSLADYARRKVHQRLRRFSGRIRAVDARFSDVNGPRGGRDKRCLITVHVPGRAPLNIEELHQDFYAGINLALGRVAQLVGRKIERAREGDGFAVRRTS